MAWTRRDETRHTFKKSFDFKGARVDPGGDATRRACIYSRRDGTNATGGAGTRRDATHVQKGIYPFWLHSGALHGDIIFHLASFVLLACLHSRIAMARLCRESLNSAEEGTREVKRFNQASCRPAPPVHVPIIHVPSSHVASLEYYLDGYGYDCRSSRAKKKL